MKYKFITRDEKEGDYELWTCKPEYDEETGIWDSKKDCAFSFVEVQEIAFLIKTLRPDLIMNGGQMSIKKL